MARTPAPGPNRAAALEALDELDLRPAGRPLAALLLTLADQLDGNAGAQYHNLAREYRLALQTLRELHPEPFEPDAFDEFVANLPNAQ